MKYVLLFVETEKFEQDFEAMTQADRDRASQLAHQWMADHAGKIRSGSKLQSASTATTVRLDAGDEPVVTDGPFVELTEQIGGYYDVELPDLDAAIAAAKLLPRAYTLEIRSVVGVEGYESR
jgi:hypothetical protein